jgi:hypothetical protein
MGAEDRIEDKDKKVAPTLRIVLQGPVRNTVRFLCLVEFNPLDS